MQDSFEMVVQRHKGEDGSICDKAGAISERIYNQKSAYIQNIKQMLYLREEKTGTPFC